MLIKNKNNSKEFNTSKEEEARDTNKLSDKDEIYKSKEGQENSISKGDEGLLASDNGEEKTDIRDTDNNLSNRFNQSKSNSLASNSLTDSLKTIIAGDRQGILLYSATDLPDSMLIDKERSIDTFDIVELEKFNILEFFENKRKVLSLLVFGRNALKLLSDKKDIFVFVFMEILEFDDYDYLIDMFPLITKENHVEREKLNDYSEFIGKITSDKDELVLESDQQGDKL